MRRFLLTIVLASAALHAAPIPDLASRISELAAQEPPDNAIETLLRAADLLRQPAPEISRKFLAQGRDLLRAHPEVPRDRTIVNSLMFLDPENGESLLMTGTNRINAYNEMLRYENQRGQWDRLAATLRKALREPAVLEHVEDLWAASILAKMDSAPPKLTAQLFVELAAASRKEVLRRD